MRSLIQRISKAKVEVEGRTVGKIEEGLLVFVCAMTDDSKENAISLAKKIVNLRIFRDAEGKMNKSLLDIGGQALIVSQFTLAADASRGNRPGFSSAAPPDTGKELYEFFAAQIAGYGIDIQMGVFGADMAVSLTNDGPVTIWLEI